MNSTTRIPWAAAFGLLAILAATPARADEVKKITLEVGHTLKLEPGKKVVGTIQIMDAMGKNVKQTLDKPGDEYYIDDNESAVVKFKDKSMVDGYDFFLQVEPRKNAPVLAFHVTRHLGSFKVDQYRYDGKPVTLPANRVINKVYFFSPDSSRTRFCS
jgi:hypothetical protein